MKRILVLALVLLLAACAPRYQSSPPAQPPSYNYPPVAQPVPQPVSYPPQTQPIPQPVRQVQEAPPTQTTPSTTKTVDATMQGFAFNPSTITIKAGDSVRWTNMDSASHTATGSGFDTGTLSRGQSKMITFDKPGTYSYTCSFHPNMHGTIVVQ